MAARGNPIQVGNESFTPSLHLLLLWMAGISLRITVLAVPPLLPAIHRSLHLGETAVGILSALPVLLLATAAIPGSLLIARVGARRALVTGLIAVAVSGALRGAGPSTAVFFLMTFVMGMGIAISQPALPTLVRQWFPYSSGPATAVYSNGYLIGELVPAALTVPILLNLVGGRWPVGLAVWSAVVLVTAGAILAATAHVPRDVGGKAVALWPDWRDGVIWRLGLILGSASISYWVSNAFIPDYLRATNHSELITPALTVLNLSQLPASLLVLLRPGRVIARRWPFVAAGLATCAVAVGLQAGGYWVVVLGGVIGFASAVVFVLCLALPPVLAGEHDVHRMSAGLFTISYACPFTASLAGGALWDSTGLAILAFAPLAVGGALMAFLGSGLRLRPADV